MYPGAVLGALLIRWAVLAGAFAVTAWLLSGVTVSGGMQSNGAASAAVATLLAAKLALLQASPLYRILRVSPDQVRTIAGGDQLTADIAVSCKVDI